MENKILVLSGFEMERRRVVHTLSTLPRLKYEVGVSLNQLMEAIQSFDLLPASCFILDKVEGLKKEEAEQLLESIPPTSLLILSGSSFKGSVKGMRVYDFTKEKPWERLSRLKLWLQEEAKLMGKTVTPSALTFLIEKVSQDFGQLEQELAKLSCYVGERPLIDLQDVKMISSSLQEVTGWQLAEALIWEGRIPAEEPLFDMGLIGQIRYHLQLGEQIASLLENQQPLSQIPLNHKQLDKYLAVVKERPRSFFQRGLQLLFECELACKNSAIPQPLLWMRVKAELLT